MEDDKRSASRAVALWAGVMTFCTNLVAFKVLALMVDGNLRIGLSALLTSLAVSGAIYAKERLNTARLERNGKD